MPGNRGNIPHIPWSRHMVVSPKISYVRNRDHPENDLEGNRLPNWIEPGTPRNVSVGTVLLDRRRVKSESTILNMDKAEDDEDSWDSKSDPGSTCSSKWNKRYSSKRLCTPEEVERDASSSKKIGKECGKKRKPCIQGRGGSEENGIRRRKGAKQVAGNGDVVLEMPVDVDLSSNPSPRYVQAYSEFMYYACLNPHKWNTKEETEQTKWDYTLSIIQKVIFCYIAIMATFTSLNLIKFYVLNFLDRRTLSHFIDIGYFVVSCLFQMYIVYFIAFHSKHVSIWDNLECETGDTMNGMGEQVKPKQRKEYLPILNGIATIVFIAIKTMSRLDSFENIISKHADDTVDGLFLWTPQHYDNRKTILDHYLATHGTLFYAFGFFGYISTFCCNLLADCFKDLIFWVAKVHEHRITVFGNKIKENIAMKLASKEYSAEEIDDHDDQCWKMYRELLDVNRSINKSYHILFVLNHLDAFLTFSYFLTIILSEDTSMFGLVHTGYDVVKGIIAYFPARRASLQNEECRRWIQSLKCETNRFRATGASQTRDVMLWELKEEPLGLGNGKVHINNEFLVSFITLVASLFCFLFNLDLNDTQAKQL